MDINSEDKITGICKDCEHYISGEENKTLRGINERNSNKERCSKTYYVIRKLTNCITGLFNQKQR